MLLERDEILYALNAESSESGYAKIIKNVETNDKYAFSTDTRTIKPGDIYIPLKGDNFDGEKFLESALEAGASGYFTSDETKNIDAKFALYVPDTKEAYLKLANFYKRKMNPFTIMITGSSGKTTVKEMMYSVFSLFAETVKSELNHNNEIGLCQTISSLSESTKYLIVEAGMRGPGEIELISKYCEPDIGVIVNSGTAHIGRLGSELNIAKAKFEITKYLNEDGVLISHDNPLIRQINDNKHKTVYFSLDDSNLKIKEMTAETSLFEYKGEDYKLNVSGEHNVQNALGVIEAGLFAGIAGDIIKQGLLNFKPIEKRWDVQKIAGFNIINDSYNSNPDSLKAALKTFLSYTDGKKALVLGDMGELGGDEKKYHEEIGKFLENFDCDCIITAGELSKYINPSNIKTVHLDDTKSIAGFIKENIPQGENILLKASRFMKFEDITEELKTYEN